MSDPYWQGSRLPALLIALFLLILFSVAFGFGRGIIDSLSDWVDGLQVWKSPVWLKLKVPIIILVVVGSLVVLLAYLRYEGQKEQQAVQKHAEGRGWSFSRWDETQEIRDKVETIFRDFQFDDPYWIRIVEAGQRHIFLFNCSYKHRKASGRSQSSNKIACLIQSERFRPTGIPVTIGIREWRGKMLSLMRWDEVAMENPLFAEKFLVLSEDPAMAREIVNESMQAMLLEHIGKPEYTPASITIGPGGAVVMTEQDLKHERLPDLIDLARRTETTAEE
jgi:hypothetical protein